MKKILMSLLVIALAVGGVAGASGAWFSDTEETVGNTFTAGIIDISLQPDTGQDVKTVEAEMFLKPCMTGYIEVRVTNEGNNPVEVWKHLKEVVSTEGETPDAEIDFYEDWVAQTGQENDTPELWRISDVIMYDMWIQDGCCDGDEPDRNPFVFVEGLDRMIIDEADGYTVTEADPAQPETTPPAAGDKGVECWYIYLGVLDVGESMLVVQSYHMKSEVGNWAQGDIMSFTMEFFGQQTEGVPQPLPPQPDQTTGSMGELPGFGRGADPINPCPCAEPSGSLSVTGTGWIKDSAWCPCDYKYDLTDAGEPVALQGFVDTSATAVANTGDWSKYYAKFIIEDSTGKVVAVVFGNDWLGAWYEMPAQPWDRIRMENNMGLAQPERYYATVGGVIGYLMDGTWVGPGNGATVYPSDGNYFFQLIADPALNTFTLQVYGKGSGAQDNPPADWPKQNMFDEGKWLDIGTIDVGDAFDFEEVSLCAELWASTQAGAGETSTIYWDGMEFDTPLTFLDVP